MSEQEPSGVNAPLEEKTTLRNLLIGPLLFLVGVVTLDSTLYAESASFGAASVAFGLLLWMAWWWLSEALPLAVTSLLPLVVLPFLGVLDARIVAPKYFSDTIALFFGGFCLALALEYTGLHRRLAAIPLRFVKGSASRAVGAMLLTAGVLSMWVSNTATTLALLPVAISVARALDPEKKHGLGSRLVLAVAFGAAIGGIGTIVGTPPNAFLQAYYNDAYAAEIAAGTRRALSFGRWMIIGMPIVALLLPCAYFLLARGLKGVKLAAKASDAIESGKFTTIHKAVMAIFAVTVTLWLTRAEIVLGDWSVPMTGWGAMISPKPGTSMVSDGSVAMLAALLLFLLPGKKGERLLPWKWAVHRLPWDALLLFGGGLALAAAIEASGLGKDLVGLISGLTLGEGSLALGLFVLLILVAMTLFSEFSSNTAAAAIAIPLLASLGSVIGGEFTLMLAGTLGASCGYALPVATPPNTIAYASGEVTVRDMVRRGVFLDLCAIAVMLLVILLIVPFLA